MRPPAVFPSPKNQVYALTLTGLVAVNLGVNVLQPTRDEAVKLGVWSTILMVFVCVYEQDPFLVVRDTL